MEVRSGYKQTEVGLIPEDWKVQTLNELSIISRLAGAEYTSLWEETPNGDIIALRGFNIGQGKIIERDFVRISNKLSLRLKRSRLCKGDVVYPCVGSIGNAVIIDEDDKYHIQQNIARITPDHKAINSGYLANYLMSFLAAREVERFTSSSSQPSVLVGSLRQYRIPLPPTKAEQEVIATALSDVDALLAKLDQFIAKKRDLKQAAMQQLLTGETRLPGFSGAWEVKRLGDVFSISTGKSKSAYVIDGGQYWVVDMGSVSTDGKLIVSKATNYCDDFLSIGELVMPKDDIGGGGIIGKVGYIDADDTYVLGDHVYRLKANRGNPLFLSYVINGFRTNSELRKKVIGTAQLGLGRKSVDDQEVPFPQEDEQTAIATVLSDMDAEIAALESRRVKTREIKQGMMQELLTGRIRLV